MSVYDSVRVWQNRFLLIINTLRLRIQFYRNIKFKGFENVHFSTQIYGRLGGKVTLGRRVSTEKWCTLVAVGGHLKIGDNTSFNRNCDIVCHESIDIGSQCMFGPGVVVYDHDHQFGPDGIREGYKTKPILVGDNCWIGANAIILRGTHIGEGCVIGAGTVVKGEIPPHSIVVNDRTATIRPIQER